MLNDAGLKFEPPAEFKETGEHKCNGHFIIFVHAFIVALPYRYSGKIFIKSEHGGES